MTLLALVFAGGCTNTLVFGERASFNLAIHVNDNPITPLQVNAGLKRAVAGIVPPNDVTEVDNQKVPVGEAVSLFSGFNLGYERPELATPFSGKLTIRTQFASGKAAIAVADDPQVVNEIVDATFTRTLSFVEQARQARVDALLEAVGSLSDAEVLSLSANPPVNDPNVENVVKLRDPSNRRLTDAAVAREMLKTRIVLGERSDEFLNAWEAAILAQG